jgi:hypothetical protein
MIREAAVTAGVIVLVASLNASAPRTSAAESITAIPPVPLAQATTAPAGAEGATPTTAEERMRRRYPQPAQVGDLIGLPLLDEKHITLGRVREVVRNKADKIELVVAYGGGLLGFLGWGTRPVAVPIEVVGIRGRELASLDMPRSEYATAPTWQKIDAMILPADSTILVALCRGY